jgi:hypothetical protein
MTAYSPRADLLWWSPNAVSTTLSVAGTYHSAAIDLRDVCDVWLAVSVVGTATGTTPTLTVSLDVQDASGAYLPSGLALTQITASPATGAGSAGLHIASTGSMCLPAFGRVTWVLGGTTPVYPGVSISLYGR